jgi:hypothetical protein
MHQNIIVRAHMTRFSVIPYKKLNSRQQEIFNFQKVSGVLADYGFATHRFTDDWNGADFLAVHVDGKTLLRVQLKGRLTFDKKYLKKNVWLCFRHNGSVYLGPHDKLAKEVLKLAAKLGEKRYDESKSWNKPNGGYSYGAPPKWMLQHLSRYRLGHEGESAL